MKYQTNQHGKSREEMRELGITQPINCNDNHNDIT